MTGSSDQRSGEPIPFVDLRAQRVRLGRRVEEAMARVLEHGTYIMGPEVAELETRLADWCGARHAISCASGTDALVMVLMAWGVGAGHAVYVPSFTFAATAEAVALVGATPVFVDVLADDFNIDPAGLVAAIQGTNAHLKPACVIPVDLYGQPADYPAITDIAQAHGLRVLADAAQSFGAAIGDRRVGTLGDATTTSFFPAKPLGCYGDGGAVFTDDEETAEILRSIRAHGKGREKYDNVRIGLNGRLDTIQAAVLLEKLNIFPDELSSRRRVAAFYSMALDALVTVPPTREGTSSAWAQYTVKLERRDEIARLLQDLGIPTVVYYPKPLHQQTAYRGFPRATERLPVSEQLANVVLSLPMHPYLTDSVLARIVDAFAKSLERLEPDLLR